MINKSLFNLLILSFCFNSIIVAQRVELGEVNWLRDYEEALKRSETQNKPVFILFQEVPGCATCQNFGQNVLSDPFMVEAIENEFVPLVIYNNKQGKDREILNKYNEPSWNNPVVRIVNSQGKDIITRLGGVYNLEGVMNYMTTALQVNGIKIPPYLELYENEKTISNNDTEEAYYSMYCFWSGEGNLGGLDGIIESNPGFMNGKEVVHLKYDKNVLNEKSLKQIAEKHQYKAEEKNKFRLDKDPQYYLKNSLFKYLALTSSQKSKINSALYHKDNALKWLSPSQIEYIKLIKNKKLSPDVLYTDSFENAWAKMKENLSTKA